jgi:predicted kinase
MKNSTLDIDTARPFDRNPGNTPVSFAIMQNMAKSILIIVSGLPATGKTTLSRGIANHLGIPLVSKDEIKEVLFDELGHGDREQGEKLNTPTYKLLNYFVERELSAGHSLVVESPYDDDFPRNIYEQWQVSYRFQCIQVMCYAEPQVLIDRFITRIGAPDRHPGHNDQAALDDFKKSIKNAGKVKPLSLDGEVYELNTTNFAEINTEALLRKLEKQIVNPSKDKHSRSRLRLLARLWFAKNKFLR